MKTLINIILIIFAVVLQISLAPKFAIYGGFPNLVLLTMLSLIFIGKTSEALWWLGLGGILLDLVSPTGFGIYIFPMIVIFILVYHLTNKIFSDPMVSIALVFFTISSFVLDIPWMITSSFFINQSTQWLVVFSNAIYNTIVGCIIYILVRHYLKPKESIKI